MVKLQDLKAELVIKKEEEALIHLMKSQAVRQCTAEQRAYYDCVKGRTLSVVRPVGAARVS